jgi:hypothetical protein
VKSAPPQKQKGPIEKARKNKVSPHHPGFCVLEGGGDEQRMAIEETAPLDTPSGFLYIPSKTLSIRSGRKEAKARWINVGLLTGL